MLFGWNRATGWLLALSTLPSAIKHELFSVSDHWHELLGLALFLRARFGNEVGLPKLVLAISIGLHIQRQIALAIAVCVDAALWQNDENAIIACFVFDSFGSLDSKKVEAYVDCVVGHRWGL